MATKRTTRTARKRTTTARKRPQAKREIAPDVEQRMAERMLPDMPEEKTPMTEEEAEVTVAAQAAVEQVVANQDGSVPTNIKVQVERPREKPRVRFVQNVSGDVMMVSDIGMSRAVPGQVPPGLTLYDGDRTDLLDYGTPEEINRSAQLKRYLDMKSKHGSFPALKVFDSENDMEEHYVTVPPPLIDTMQPKEERTADPNEYDDALVLLQAKDDEYEKRVMREASSPIADRKTTPGFDVDEEMKRRTRKRGRRTVGGQRR